MRADHSRWLVRSAGALQTRTGEIRRISPRFTWKERSFRGQGRYDEGFGRTRGVDSTIGGVRADGAKQSRKRCQVNMMDGKTPPLYARTLGTLTRFSSSPYIAANQALHHQFYLTPTYQPSNTISNPIHPPNETEANIHMTRHDPVTNSLNSSLSKALSPPLPSLQHSAWHGMALDKQPGIRQREWECECE